MSMRQSARLRATVAATAIVALLAAQTGPAGAFCGFYVAKADSKLFNKSSKVVLARQGNTTAITMASDYEGEPKEFALVIPVPTFIERKQIGVVDMKTIDHLDAFTAPRLVEFNDADPCAALVLADRMTNLASMHALMASPMQAVRYEGVTVEASYDVGEYDVSILSAKQSDGLTNWLNDNGYRIPAGAEKVLASYIKQNMHFFIAKVNLDRMKLIGSGYLRPLQVRYETPKFMLPLRLGTVNAKGPQDLLIYMLTSKGRVEPVNYRAVKLPTGEDVPNFVKGDFGTFYKAVFDRAVERENMRAVFVEYAWDLSSCDPCASAPMTSKELIELGARWLARDGTAPVTPAANNAYVTRMHVRYDAASFPEDLAFVETADRENYQARYVLNHPWHEATACHAGKAYRKRVAERFEREADNLVNLTGWPRGKIDAQMAEAREAFSKIQ